MKLKLNKTENNQLTEDGHIICEASCGHNEAPPLMLITVDFLQMLADNFAAGHSIKVAGIEIKGDPNNHDCPGCKADKAKKIN